MTGTVDTSDAPDDWERDEVDGRLRGFVDIGFTVEQAIGLAFSDVSLSGARELLRSGCDPATACQILL